MRSRYVVAIGLALILGFGGGYMAAAQNAHVPVFTADGYVGADQASFVIGDTTYGFRSSVAWRDAAGSEHDSGWPACLPKLQAVQDVRFAGAVLRYGTTGAAEVVWVDCQR